MKTTTTATPRAYTFTLAIIEGDKTTYSTLQAPSHVAALQAAPKTPAQTVRAYYSPFGDTLPLAAMHVTASTLSGIARRGVGDVPRQQCQLAAARHTLRNMAQHGAESVTIPHDIQDYFQTAALALVNHAAPLATIAPPDIQAAYHAAMCAVSKAYRADTRGVQQAAAGQEMPRLFGSPTMRSSTPHRRAPQSYIDAIAAIRRALPSQQARAVLDAWREHPNASTRELAELADAKKSIIAKHVKHIRDIANVLYPNSVSIT
jgi:hypothetical protein